MKLLLLLPSTVLLWSFSKLTVSRIIVFNNKNKKQKTNANFLIWLMYIKLADGVLCPYFPTWNDTNAEALT